MVDGTSPDYAVHQGWLPASPLAEVKRTSKRHERQRILRRDDFYDRRSTARSRTPPSARENAFWLLGADAGFRPPGEALGLKDRGEDLAVGVARLCRRRRDEHPSLRRPASDDPAFSLPLPRRGVRGPGLGR